jgi:general secretion pathway protein D
MTMKTIINLTLAAALAAGTLEAFAQDDALARLRAQRAQEEQQLGGQQPAETTPSPSADNGTVGAGGANAATTVPPAAATQMEPATAATDETADDNSAGPEASFTNDVGTNGITMNFRNAPLSRVLSYMSDAAGFIIVLDTPVNGYVNVISTHPMTKDEAVDLLNTVLNQNNLAAILDDDGRTMTIMTKAQALKADIKVVVGNDATNIPNNDEIVTQIIPIRFVDSQQLVVDLSPFVSSQATIVANQEGNSIIITDTQSNIRHLVKIIESIDSSAETETKVEVFPLKYANPNDIVTMLQGVFPDTSGSQAPISFGGRGGRGGGNPFAALFSGAANSSNSGSQARIQKAQQVVAVADGRTQSVVVTAAKDMMPQIEEMIRELDVKSERDTTVYTVHLDNADPYAVLTALQSAFPSSSTSRSSSSSSTTQSLLQQRPTQMNNSSSSSSSSSSFGTTSGSSGGGSRGGGGF